MAFEDFMDDTFGKTKWLSPGYGMYRGGKALYDYATSDDSASVDTGNALDAYNNSYAKYLTPGIGPMHAIYDAANYVGNSGMFDWMGGDEPEAPAVSQPQEPERDLGWYRQNLDFEDKDMIKELQGKLGVEQDGMFGPQTQSAYRRAIQNNANRKNKMNENLADFGSKIPFVGDDAAQAGADFLSPKEDVLKYDYNPEMLQHRVEQSGPAMGLLKKGWYGLDDKLGGILPGGVQKKYKNMSQSEYDDETFMDI